MWGSSMWWTYKHWAKNNNDTFFDNNLKKTDKKLSKYLKNTNIFLKRRNFLRLKVEFQFSWSLHIYSILWIQNAPKLKSDAKLTCIKFVGKPVGKVTWLSMLNHNSTNISFKVIVTHTKHPHVESIKTRMQDIFS